MSDLRIIKTTLNETVNSPDFFLRVCDFVVGGGTLEEFCLQHDGMSFPLLLRWIKSDKDRWAQYKLAQEDRGEFMRESMTRLIRDMATADIGEITTADGEFKPMGEWSPQLKRSIVGIKHGKDGTEIKFADKLKATELMAKVSGLLKDKVEHTGKLTLEQMLAVDPPKPIYDKAPSNDAESDHQHGETRERDSTPEAH